VHGAIAFVNRRQSEHVTQFLDTVGLVQTGTRV